MNILVESLFLPPIAFFQEVINFSKINIEIHEHFQKQTFRNRCYILSANGPQILTVPVHHSGKIHSKDIIIDNSQRWNSIMWRSVCTSYGNSPFFEHYRDDFEKIILTKNETLVELNTKLLKLCFKLLNINNIIEFTTEYESQCEINIKDIRNKYLPSIFKPVLTSEYNHKYFQQFGNIFVLNLSILDLLFNVGTNSSEYLYYISNQFE
ncbi:MAG: WbqC family protein [Bacteroidota bacterium]|nr:WbqC family protein [Bacteroidota bacterium]